MKMSILFAAYTMVVAAGAATAHEFKVPDAAPAANIIQVDSSSYNGRYDSSADRECAMRNEQAYNGDSSSSNNNDMAQKGLDALGAIVVKNDSREDYSSNTGPVSPGAIVHNLELNDFHDVSRPVRSGGNYSVYAMGPDGRDVELVVDANNCEIVRTRDRS
jgi:hypothetical protein